MSTKPPVRKLRYEDTSLWITCQQCGIKFHHPGKGPRSGKYCSYSCRVRANRLKHRDTSIDDTRNSVPENHATQDKSTDPQE